MLHDEVPISAVMTKKVLIISPDTRVPGRLSWLPWFEHAEFHLTRTIGLIRAFIREPRDVKDMGKGQRDEPQSKTICPPDFGVAP